MQHKTETKSKTGLERLKQLYFTIMLPFYVLIGLNKVPELLLTLLCQELTGDKDKDECFIECTCICHALCVYGM